MGCEPGDGTADSKLIAIQEPQNMRFLNDRIRSWSTGNGLNGIPNALVYFMAVRG